MPANQVCFGCSKQSSLLLALLLFVAACASGQTPPTYYLFTTNIAGSGTDIPMGMNNNGDTWVFNPAKNHGFLWNVGTADMGALNNNPSYSVATAANDSQIVTGWSLTNGQTHAIRQQPGSIQDIGTLGGANSYGLGVNNSGVIVGMSLTSTSKTHAFSWFNGVMSDIGAFAGDYSEARGINSIGQIVGDSTTVPNQRFHAFVKTGRVMTDLGTLGGTDSYGMAINNAGQAVGYSFTKASEIHPFLFAGVMHDLGTLGGTVAEATAINTFGQIVGYSFTAGNATKHAFLYQNGTMYDLNTASFLLPTGWVLNSAWAINDRAEISGYATDQNGQPQVFRLEPLLPNNCSPSTYATQFVDVTGDHRADLIAINDTGILVMRGDTLAGFGPLAEIWSSVPFFGAYHIDGLTMDNEFFADVDGDGKADAIVVNDTGITVRRSDGTKFLSNEQWATSLLARSYHISGVSHPNIYFADVNHDGAADAISVDDNGVWVSLADKISHVFRPAVNWTGSAFYGTNGTFVADVTDDGAADVIAVNKSRLNGAAAISVRSSNWTGFNASQSWSALSYFPTTFADIDGNGTADEVMDLGSSGLWVGPSYAGSFNFYKFPAWYTAPYTFVNYATYYADVDNDPNFPGAADAIRLGPWGVSTQTSTGSAFSSPLFGSENLPMLGHHDVVCQ